MLELGNISIRRKLTLIIMAASTVGLLLISGSFIAYELITFRQSMTRDLSTLAEVIGTQSTAAITYDDRNSATEILSALSANQHITGAAIYKGNELFVRYTKKSGGKMKSVPPHPSPEGARFEQDHLILYRPIHLAGEPIGTIYLRSNLDEMQERLWRYAGIIVLFMISSLIVTYVASSLLQRIISRPIFNLLEAARTVSENKNYAVRARKAAHDELGQLTDGFNEMLGQIQEREAALQRANDKLEKRVYERTTDLQLEITERKKAETALQEQLTRISLLNRITGIITDRQDLSGIFRLTLRHLESDLGIDAGMVCLYDAQMANLTLSALKVHDPLVAGRLNLPEGCRVTLDQGALKQCLGGESVYRKDISPAQTPFEKGLAESGFRSLVLLPLMAESELFGLLIVARSAEGGFTQEETGFLNNLSEHVSLAAHQAQLHGKLEQAYNELRQTQLAVMQQERLKALGQMASGIAHDINNALSPVVGFADLLVRSEPSLSENGRKSLHYIKTAGEDIAQIVARLREFYRRRTQRESLVALNLNSAAQQVIDMTRPRWRDMAQGQGLMIEVESSFESGLSDLAGNETEVREAMTNLILNAVDALPQGGKIMVRTRWARRNGSAAQSGETGTHVLVEVCDNGVGMNETTRKHCLEPFFSTKGKRGTGLGLAMVYGIMERHEGEIEIQSQPGKGTTVRLIFPIRKSAAETAPGVKPVESRQTLQILCIDDEPLLRELLKDLLEAEGHRVQVSDGGQAGLNSFRSARERGQPFDVVITDLGMPYVDGRQVAKTLKRESPKTPIILLTGWGAYMKEDGETPAQVDGVLSKPPRVGELRDTLMRLVSPN